MGTQAVASSSTSQPQSCFANTETTAVGIIASTASMTSAATPAISASVSENRASTSQVPVMTTNTQKGSVPTVRVLDHGKQPRSVRDQLARNMSHAASDTPETNKSSSRIKRPENARCDFLADEAECSDGSEGSVDSRREDSADSDDEKTAHAAKDFDAQETSNKWQQRSCETQSQDAEKAQIEIF